MKQISRTHPLGREFRYNENVDNYQIEPELQRPTPRDVHCRDGFWGTVRPFWILLLPHTWIAIVAPFVLLVLYAQALLADKVPGTVIDQSSYHAKGALHYRVKYRFLVDNREHINTQNISESKQEAYPIGGSVNVRVFKYLPDFNPQLDGITTDQFVLPFATLWVSVWCGVMFPLMWMSIMPAFKSRHLCRIGKAVGGQLLNIETVRGSKGGTTYYAHYSYPARDRSSGRTLDVVLNKKFRFPGRALDRLHAGQTITILYDPDKPSNSIPYVLGDYAAG
ncbi:MAG TPA: DUF3592 domain-containing protein [Candidatus Obscuribacterales bacterium]